MSRRGRSDEPSLFDLPLVPDDEPEQAPPAGGARGAGETAAAASAPAVDRRPAADPDLAADADLDQAGLDDPLFASDPLPFDPPIDDPLADELPGAGAAARAAAPAAPPPAPEEPLEGPAFPFDQRPPPHRTASPTAAPAPAARPTPTHRSPAPSAAPPAGAATPAAPGSFAPSRSPAAALAPAADPAGWDVVEVADGDDEPAEVSSPPAAAAGPVRAGLGPRLVAAAFDGMALVAAGALALIGAALLDVRPGLAGLPGLAALLLVFSFAYSVVPLAFWGATPGMRVARLAARDRDGGPLTFGQTALRWLGALLTVALAGLPMLLAVGPLGARSPADRLSRSLTWLRRD